MKLDNKIKDNKIKDNSKIFTCFDTEQAKQYVDTMGYFTDDISDFNNLDDCYYDTLNRVDDNSSRPFFNKYLSKYFTFFLPEKFAKEKKFRPYTLQEFKGNLPKMIFPDDLIHYRHKNNEDNEFSEYAQRYNGYIVNSRATAICLGSREYTLGDLFKNFEYLGKDGEWNTFGAE